MRSFVFWLATAVAFGALLGSTLRPGFPEIVILWLVVVSANYGWKSYSSKQRSGASAAGG